LFLLISLLIHLNLFMFYFILILNKIYYLKISFFLISFNYVCITHFSFFFKDSCPGPMSMVIGASMMMLDGV
jgi:hypothetical protein